MGVWEGRPKRGGCRLLGSLYLDLVVLFGAYLNLNNSVENPILKQ